MYLRDQRIFPTRTYQNFFSNPRNYYAFGNTPPEDLLSCLNGQENPNPDILSLGCGDMRSCLYTILMHFYLKLENSVSFAAVRFILNDISPGVLARNVIQLLLAVEMPNETGKAKNYLKKAWSIVYNHCLTDEELELLNCSLERLLCWTESEEKWKETRENPLRNCVTFYSMETIENLREMWSLWHGGYPHSKEEMLKVRQDNPEYFTAEDLAQFKSVLASLAEDKCSGLIGKYSVHEFPDAVTRAARKEMVDYMLLDGRTPVDDGVTADFVNPTLFERLDWNYSMEFGSLPFYCFHHSFMFKKGVLKNLGLDQKMMDVLPVDDLEFGRSLLWANSFQQFAMMFVSLRDVLGQISEVRFQFHRGDCLDLLAQHAAALQREVKHVRRRYSY